MEAVAVAAELRSADEVAIAAIGLEALVSKAGYALALGVRRTAGRCVGLRVVVLAGPGLNGADGRAAAKVLRKFGATVSVVEVGTPVLPACDVVVDAAFGTGCSRPFAPPQLTGTPLVVAADLPSGLDATTGVVHGRALKADRTVTFGALKPGLLYQQGRALAGSIEVATLDLVLTTAVEQVTNDDLAALPPLSEERHKWTVAVGVVAGSSGMYGAPSLVASAALRTGAGMVCVATSAPELSLAREAVLSPLPAGAWSVLAETTFARCGALVLGPGIGRDQDLKAKLEGLLLASDQAVVLDADALHLLGPVNDLASILSRRSSTAPVVLLPHDGEYTALFGSAPGSDRLQAARVLAEASGATVLLKGPTTVVAPPDGSKAYVVSGNPSNLATAGSGDVLAGICGAMLARGDLPGSAARTVALASRLHAMAAALGPRQGLVSSDLPASVAEVLEGGANHGR